MLPLRLGKGSAIAGAVSATVLVTPTTTATNQWIVLRFMCPPVPHGPRQSSLDDRGGCPLRSRRVDSGGPGCTTGAETHQRSELPPNRQPVPETLSPSGCGLPAP